MFTQYCTGRVHSGNVKITSTFPAPKDFWGILKLKSIRDSKKKKAKPNGVLVSDNAGCVNIKLLTLLSHN